MKAECHPAQSIGMAVQKLLLDIIRIATRLAIHAYTHMVRIAVPYAYGCTMHAYAYTHMIYVPGADLGFIKGGGAKSR